MAHIVIFGGTGYTGGNIAREAVSRGHRVVSVSRSQPKDRIDGVDYELGPALDVAERVVPGADAVVVALSPNAELTRQRLVEVHTELARRSAEAGARYLQIGGFSSLRPAPGAPRFVEGEVPEQFREAALSGEATRAMLAEDAPEDLDWVFLSPAASYGPWAPGERRGTYRIGGEVALRDDEGGSHLSGADFALAVVDEIESAAHSRAHVGVAY